jgi:SnoaL-like domain
MPNANELLRINLHEVTSERDPEKRRAAIERAYVEDVRFLDSEAELVGRQAFCDRVQKILDDAPADFVLEEDGPAYVGPDTAAQPWRFGPPGNPALRGMDVLTLRDDKVSAVVNNGKSRRRRTEVHEDTWAGSHRSRRARYRRDRRSSRQDH